ncbi:thiamine phosphate synthase [Nocardioides ultimimeridianus]
MRRLPRIFCLVSDEHDLSLLPAIAEAGATGFQVRAKSLGSAALLDLTRDVLAAVAGLGAVVVVNDRVDIALAAGADGVHLGAEDLPVALARELAPDLLIGATCRTRADVEAARAAGADYAGLGPVFASGSKQVAGGPLGVSAVSSAAGVLPLVAISGIDAGNAGAVIGAGAHGVAVIGGIWSRPDPVAAAKELVAAVG